jgi:AAA ATPase-like protein
MISASPIFGRDEELEQLRNRIVTRRSFLFHGPAGVGKTLLLRRVVSELTDVLYCPQNPSSQFLYRNLAESLLVLEHHVLTKACPSGKASLQEKSAVSVKGLVRDALIDAKSLVIVDHLMRPSQVLAASVRELMLNWSIPVIAVSRSAHMEDAGFVLPLFPDRPERFALQNFNFEPARRFAAVCAEREGLTAENVAQFLDRVVEYCDGNPGAVAQMIRMANAPKYLHENQIKITPLFIDYRIGMVSQ